MSVDRQQWVKTLEKQRTNYTNLVENFVNRQSKIQRNEEEEEFMKLDDHVKQMQNLENLIFIATCPTTRQ